MRSGIFNILLLAGRPALGKSEIIGFLARTSLAERRARFHVGDLKVLDDFPMQLAWFEEGDIPGRKVSLPPLHFGICASHHDG